VGFRFKAFMSGEATAIDIVVFLVGVALFLTPLFQEVNILGVKLKREIETLKTEVKDQILNLRLAVQNVIDIRHDVNIFNLPSGTELSEEGKAFLKAVKSKKLTYPPEELLRVPEENKFLFSVRYEIEKELNRIWMHRYQEDLRERRVPFYKKIRMIQELEGKYLRTIEYVYKISTAAIHGVDVGQGQIEFVKRVYKELITFLRSID